MPDAPSPIVQIAYIVPDLQDAAQIWRRRTGAGPFFMGNSASLADATYRGEQSTAQFDYLVGHSGDLQIELIQTQDDAPSIYREVRERSGYGYHHFLPLVPDYDKALADYVANGDRVAFTAIVGGVGRVALLDDGQSGGFIEIVEPSASFLKGLAILKSSAAGWDGKDLVRPMSALRQSRPPHAQ